MNTEAPEARPAIAGEETFRHTWPQQRVPLEPKEPRPAPPSASTPEQEQEPIYADLSRAWVRLGRTAPGTPDQEWHHLARAAPRFFAPPPESSGLPPGRRGDSPGRHRRSADSGSQDN